MRNHGIIRQLTIITSQGVSFHTVGIKGVSLIEFHPEHINGDPYEHFIVFGKNNEVLYTINCLVPCEIEYLIP